VFKGFGPDGMNSSVVPYLLALNSVYNDILQLTI